MGKAIKLPSLFEVLQGMGIATGEVQARLDRLKARFPAGEVPITEVQSVLSQFFTADVMNQIFMSVRDDLLDVLKTGKSKIKDDDSALA